MTRIVNMILRRLVKAGTKQLGSDQTPMTAEQREAQKRVRKAMKATQRMHRI